MLARALGQLFVDLDKAKGRSPYEEKLYQELLQLAQGLRPQTAAPELTGSGLRQAIESDPTLRVEVDVRPTDATRLSCSKSDCPNKRQ